METVQQHHPDYDVVISYAGEDREYAEKLVNALQQESVSVFYDQQAIDRLAAQPLPETLRDIFENQGRYCVVFLSKHYLEKRWTREELKAALARVERTKAYVLPVVLDETVVPDQLTDIAFLNWKAHHAEKITEVLLKKLGRSYRWTEISVQAGKTKDPITFTDIGWIGDEGWLSVAFHIGGGYGPVGDGALLHTSDGGNSWHEIDKRLFPSRAGEFTWGPQGSRSYEWDEVGPIFAVTAYQRHGKPRPEIWIAASTGVYTSQDGGASWHMSTPGPDDDWRYAFFFNLASVEAFSEVYAVGWQGISHWSKAANQWNVQLPTFYYPISGIHVLGGSENRNVWAVGRAGEDETGNWGSDSHGAIYYLKPPDFTEWQRCDLSAIDFKKAQALSDIIMIDPDTVVAVGGQGIIVLGRRQKSERWDWSTPTSPTESDLYSLSLSPNALWAVGDRGVVLKSMDRGTTWETELIKQQSNGNKPVLRRTRFSGHQGWILGDGIVMRSAKL